MAMAVCGWAVPSIPSMAPGTVRSTVFSMLCLGYQADYETGLHAGSMIIRTCDNDLYLIRKGDAGLTVRAGAGTLSSLVTGGASAEEINSPPAEDRTTAEHES